MWKVDQSKLMCVKVNGWVEWYIKNEYKKNKANSKAQFYEFSAVYSYAQFKIQAKAMEQ